jgi:hypothetical protein
MILNRNISVSEKTVAIGLLMVSLAGLGLTSGVMNNDNNSNNNYQAQAMLT